MKKHYSIWLDNEENIKFPHVKDGTKVDVAIIGGGIVGITAGLMLKKQGFKVAIIESKRICSDVTGSTTAKLTISSNLIYNQLLSNFGIGTTLKFKDSGILAFNRISKIINENKIDCDYKKLPLYIYSTDKNNFKDIEKEYDAIKKLNIDADLIDDFQLPYEKSFKEINEQNKTKIIKNNISDSNNKSINKAIRYNKQAQFNPKKYCNGLAKLISGNGSYIFEKSKAINIEEGKTNKIITEKGDIFCDNVIIATNSPIYDPNSTVSYMNPIKSYMLGVYVKEKLPEAMFVDINPFHTYRKTQNNNNNNNKDLLIIAGEHHITGHGEDTNEHYKKLIEFTNKKFNIESIEYFWSNQDNKTADGLPVIGETSQKGIYLVTGFSSWGLVKATLAGIILTDLISNKENEYAKIFSPNRFKKEKSIKKKCMSNFNKKDLNQEELKLLNEELLNLKKDEAKIIKINNRRISLYKDLKSKIFVLQANCTHFGCPLSWNSAEKTWDCPQHGSIFDYKGNSIHGPAIKNLKHYLN